MDNKSETETTVWDDRLQNILNSLSKCKTDCVTESEDIIKLRESNSKLESELKEARELEKSHRYHLLMSREMIGNLQETVSQLVYLKRDVKKLKEQLSTKDLCITQVTQEKENAVQQQNDQIMKIRNTYEKQIEDLKGDNKREIQQIQNECDAQVAQFSCVIEELRAKIRDIEADNREKINLVVLEYEEKLQREVAKVTQLQEQLAREAARTDLNIDAYRRRLEELEEKLKQNQFTHYLQNSYSSQYQNQVERPYSANRNPYLASPDINPVRDPEKSGFITSQNKAANPNSLQVIYYDSKDQTPKANNCDKKGLFTITKKRKLYNDKDFQDI